jgi:hypothetical protein
MIMFKKTVLWIGLLTATGLSQANVNPDTCVYAVANAELTSNGETQHVTFKGNICDDRKLHLETASGAVFNGVLTRVTDEGVFITFSGIKSKHTAAQSKEFFLAWDHEYSLNFTSAETGEELTLVMTVSQN